MSENIEGPIVTDRGLARRLGQEIILERGKRNTETRGTLVYFPEDFAILGKHSKVTKLQIGDRIGLKVGSLMATYKPHYRMHNYIGN